MELVKGSEISDELVEVSGSGWGDALIDSTVHAKERDYVHLITGDINVYLDALGALTKCCDVLAVLVLINKVMGR